MSQLGAFIVLFTSLSSFVSLSTFSAENLTRVSPGEEAVRRISNDMGTLLQFNLGNASPLQQEIFGGPTAGNFSQFFFRRVHSIHWQEGQNGVLASVEYGKDVMNVGSQLFTANLPQIYRIATLIHEARHTEANHAGWEHAWCPSPYSFKILGRTRPLSYLSNAPVAACDDSELGAYGVQYVFLRAIGNSCSNCTEKIKEDAKLYSVTHSLFRIVRADAAERLVRRGNLEPNAALRELESYMRN